MTTPRLYLSPFTDAKVGGSTNLDKCYIGSKPVFDRGLAVLDKQWQADTAAGAAAALNAYTNGVNEIETFANLTAFTVGTASAYQVSNNKLYTLGSTSIKHGYRPFTNGQIGDTEKFHHSTVVNWVAGARLDYRLSLGAVASPTLSNVDSMAIGLGISSAGNFTPQFGGSVPGGIVATDVTTWGTGGIGSGPVYIDIDSDGVWDSFMMSTANAAYGIAFKIARSSLVAAGLKYGWYGLLTVSANAGLSGSNIIHITTVRGSMQPHRNPTIGSNTTDGSHHRFMNFRGTDGSLRWFVIPKTYNPAAPIEMISHMHGSLSGNEKSFWTRPQSIEFWRAMMDAGHCIVSTSDGASGNGNVATTGDRWANTASNLEQTEALDWMRDNFATKDWIPVGESMGGMTAVGMMKKRTVGSPIGLYMLNTGYTIVEADNDSRFSAGVRAAYGNLTTHQQVIDTVTPFDPAAMTAEQAFRNIPIRFVAGADDPDRATQGDAEYAFALATNYSPEVSRIQKPDGHLQLGSYDITDFIAFRDRCRAFAAAA